MEKNKHTSYFDFSDLVPPEEDQIIMETNSAPVQMLIDYYRDQADINDVMRSLTSHQNWIAPVMFFTHIDQKNNLIADSTSTTAGFQITPGELWIFTDPKSVLFAQKAGAKLGNYAAGLRGKELFNKIPLNIQVVRINPYAPPEHSLLLLGEIGIKLANRWAEAISFEDKIKKWEQPGAHDKTAFLNFHSLITFTDSAGAIFTILIPGGKLMKIAPVFTAPDCARKFVESDLMSPEQRAGIRQVAVTGEMLLDQSTNLRIEGVNINPFGPGPMYFLPFSIFRD